MRPAAITPAELAADPLFPRLKEWLIGVTGLAYFDDKDADLAARLRERFDLLGLRSCGEYLSRLQNPASAASELDAAVAVLTIGETYFFRYQEQFAGLRDTVLPDLIARCAGTRRLRIWSAGCATGPEPYSLAILLHRELAKELAGWDVSILGTDINRDFLARAREARYSEWALRSLPEEIRHDCFTRHGSVWELRPEYRQGVTFRYHNLVEQPFPDPEQGLSGLDLILCRNVMIYFGPEIIRRLLGQFRDTLVEGGWLLVGHSEPNVEYFQSFHLVSVPGATLYQRPVGVNGQLSVAREGSGARVQGTSGFGRGVAEVPSEGMGGGRSTAWQGLGDLPPQPPFLQEGGSRSSSPPTAQSLVSGEAVASPDTPTPPHPHTPTPPTPTLDDIRRMADRGDWEEAARLCDTLLALAPFDPGVHFLRGVVEEQRGRGEEAERFLRKALYLDRTLSLAHYHLGEVLRRKGDAAGAVRAYRNARDLAGRARETDPVPHGEGLTAGELRRMADLQLAGNPEKD